MPSRKERRDRRLADHIADLRTEVKDLKQENPPAAAITTVVNIREAGIGLSDSLTLTTITDPVFSYSDPDRGYGYSEYADEYP